MCICTAGGGLHNVANSEGVQYNMSTVTISTFGQIEHKLDCLNR